MNLAGEANVIVESSFHRQPVALEFTHLTGVAGEHFDPTGGAASVASATMEDVDAGIF